MNKIKVINERTNSRYKILVFLLGMIFFVLGCTSKLLNPIKGGSFGNEQKGILRSDVYLFVYPQGSFEVLASEKCIIKIANKVEGEFFILAQGKYEISYANLNQCFVKVGETVQKGKIIGTLKKGNYDTKDSLEMEYLRVTVKDSKGNFVENSDLFR